LKKIHIAIGVKDIAQSVEDYSKRLNAKPTVVIPNEYALWRTETLNFSIRLDPKNAGQLRHLGWEDESASSFTKETDVNGIVWERFNQKLQEEEINDLRPK
jgi:hypothetical protein